MLNEYNSSQIEYTQIHAEIKNQVNRKRDGNFKIDENRQKNDEDIYLLKRLACSFLSELRSFSSNFAS